MESSIEIWLIKDGEEFLKFIGIKKGQIMLDFGCGEGYYTIPASKAVGEKGEIYALDKDKAALNKLVRSIKKNNIKKLLHDDYYNDGYILNFRKN